MEQEEYFDLIKASRVIEEIEEITDLDIEYNYQRILIIKVINDWRNS